MTEQGLKEVDKEEYLAKLNEMNKKKEEIEQQKNGIIINNSEQFSEFEGVVPNSCVLVTMYEYNEDHYVSQVVKNDLTRRISPYVVNDTQDNATRTITYSTTQSYVSNYTFTSQAEIDAVTAGITIGSSWQATYSYSDSVTTTIRPGYKSWVEYTPIMDNSWGWMDYETAIICDYGVVPVGEGSTWLDIYIARKINGVLDGYYVVKTAPN